MNKILLFTAAIVSMGRTQWGAGIIQRSSTATGDRYCPRDAIAGTVDGPRDVFGRGLTG